MRTALVGGASKGLGLASAQALAASGHRVVMCARDRASLDEAAAAIGETAVPIVCDLGDASSLASLLGELGTRGLEVDVLVNNTGGPKPGTVLELGESEWQEGLEHLFFSTLRLVEHVLPGMRSRGFGRIVSILSLTALEPVPTLAISSVVRAGLASYTKLLGWEVAREGVTVNALLPGSFRTARSDQLERAAAEREGTSVDEVRARIAKGLPAGRVLDAKELGAVVAFLASEEASAVNGVLLPVDAGQAKSL